MHLPHELVLLVAQYLGRRDLKSARLVAKLWCSCASEFLFTTIYVSANKVDLDAFNAITSDPVLSKCVRRLVYDGAEFMLDCSKTEYLDRLWAQASSKPSASKFLRDQIQLSDCQDGEFRDLIIARFGSHRPVSEAAKQRVGKSDIITAGYRKYTEHAVYQHDSLRSGSFVNSLAQGLRKLSLLDTVILGSRWPGFWPIHEGTGSLLARKWKPSHVYPEQWVWEKDPVSFVLAEPNGIRHYFIIVAALVRAQTKLRKLNIEDMAPEIFNRSDLSKPSILGLDAIAFTGLESLTLTLVPCFADDSDQETDQRTADIGPDIDGLRVMLSSMTRLRALDLVLTHNSFYEYDQVFPKDTIWTQLETFRIFGLCSKATDLVDLLTFQMPKLQRLILCHLYISDGTWEGVVECLKQYSKLSTFKTNPRKIYQKDGTAFGCQHHLNWEVEISHYVVLGGRHPCLMPDQPDSAAEDFAKDLKPFLRCGRSSQ